jgi:hypothetical protein
MSIASAPFVTPELEQVIPDAVRLKDKLTHSAIGQSRYNATFAPTTGASGYSAGGSGAKICTFRLTSSDFMDAATMCLSFYAKGDNANATGVAIDEDAMSLIQQITVRAGGLPLYTLLDVPCVYNAMVAQTMPRSVYESNGPAAGLWRHNTKLGTDSTAGTVGNWSLQQVSGTGSYYWDEPAHKAARTAAGLWQSQGRFYSIPLSWLLPIDRYLCLRNLSSFEIEILFQSSKSTCCVSTGLGGATPAQVPTQNQHLRDGATCGLGKDVP